MFQILDLLKLSMPNFSPLENITYCFWGEIEEIRLNFELFIKIEDCVYFQLH